MKRGLMENPNLKIFGVQLLLGPLLICLIFISFYYQENGDLNVVIFGTLQYLPFVIMLCIYNGLAIRLFERINKKVKVINYCLPTVPLLIWFLASDNSITIGYWELSVNEFTIAVVALLVTNVAGYFLFQKIFGETANH